MRSNEQGLGLVAGLLAPVLGFFLYGWIYTGLIRPFLDMDFYIHDLFLGTPRYRSPILSLSLIMDLPLFFLFDRFGKSLAMRGVLTAVLLYAVVIVALWI
ncbi:MAG: hypothetical protein H6595_03310 [Flavobacteriales bacterium]|nr:hypothetical protein [Flavobacteriales bacterium]MCB9166486.1 hypothetical protein [Flavobacteriales bacterium]